ncbi:MAG: acyl-CoA dehydrogenase, partial [Alphaproteobacteria bacterium]|nr:acyl-CoA dehydrogenase [Alphaproteobacteria bacterium]
MALAAARSDTPGDLISGAHAATSAVEALLADATRTVAARVTKDGRVAGNLIDREQRAAHGLSWFATYVEAIRQLAAYAERMSAGNRFGAIEELIVRIGLGEYLAQMVGGIPMSQGEMVRPSDLGLTLAQVTARMTPAIEALIATGNTAENRARLVALM